MNITTDNYQAEKCENCGATENLYEIDDAISDCEWLCQICV